MKRIFYFEKHVKIEGEFHKLFEKIKKISKNKSKNVKNQSLEMFDKITCFDKMSMMNFNDEETRSSWFNSSMFCNFAFIIVCCSFSTNFNCRIKRCYFAIVAWSFAFNFFRCFSRRRYRLMSREAKSQMWSSRMHSRHLFESSTILHAFLRREQWEQGRIARTSISRASNKLHLRWDDVFLCLGMIHSKEKKMISRDEKLRRGPNVTSTPRRDEKHNRTTYLWYQEDAQGAQEIEQIEQGDA